MNVFLLNEPNLNNVSEKQWASFCEFIEPYIEACVKNRVYGAFVRVSNDGKFSTINFDVKEREGIMTLKAVFDKYLCKEWSYNINGKTTKKIPPHNVTLAYQVFLTKVLGQNYKDELNAFYQKNNVDTKLINQMIRNSKNDFEV